MSAQIVIDASGRVLSWNAEAARLLGYPAEEVIGHLLADTIVPVQHREQYNAGLDNFRATGTVRSLGMRLQVAVLHKDGTAIPVDLRITKLSDDPPTLLVLIDRRPLPHPLSDPYTGTEHRDYAAATEAHRAERADDLEGDRVRRATKLAIEEDRAKRKADDVAKELAELSAKVTELRAVVARTEAAVREMTSHLDTVLKATEALHTGYGVDESTMKDRSRLPSLLTWWGRLVTEEVPGTGKTRREMIDELIAQRASRMHVSASGLKVFVILTPFMTLVLGAIISYLILHK
jgi:PAS domain S-box-containing protein